MKCVQMGFLSLGLLLMGPTVMAGSAVYVGAGETVKAFLQSESCNQEDSFKCFLYDENQNVVSGTKIISNKEIAWHYLFSLTSENQPVFLYCQHNAKGGCPSLNWGSALIPPVNRSGDYTLSGCQACLDPSTCRTNH